MTASTQSTVQRGQQAEDLAYQYLEAQGLKLVERNYRCARGEIDLIMQHGKGTVFVEVRYRRSARFGAGLESVDHHKRARLIATALHYLQQHRRAAKGPSRFDVIAIAPGAAQDTIEWIQDAFQT